MKTTTRNLLLGALSSAALLGSSAASAVFVTEWDFEITAEFLTDQTVFTSGGGTQTNLEDEISWGAAGGDFTDPNQSPSDSRSAITLSSTLETGSIFTLPTGDSPTLGLGPILTHFNNTISSSFATLQETGFLTTLVLTPAAPPEALDDDQSLMLQFLVNFTETPNDGDCGFPSESNCDDIFTLSIDPTGSDDVDILGPTEFEQTFGFDGETYTINLSEQLNEIGTLTPAACAEAGLSDSEPCLGFQTPEGEFTSAQFGVTITAVTEAVPAPGTVALLGLGLLGVGYARRRAARG